MIDNLVSGRALLTVGFENQLAIRQRRNVWLKKNLPSRSKKIGHVVLNVSDIERSSKFWTEIMGFKFSDRNEIGMVFFRNATDHHTVALLQAKEKNELPKRGQVGFDHMALEVATVSELFKIRDFLRSKGVEIFYEAAAAQGVIRASNSTILTAIKSRIYAAMDQVGTDGKSRPANEWKRATTLRRGGGKSAARC